MSDQFSVPGSNATFDLVTDVVVVGFGGAGAMSAIAAADAGAEVLVVEKMPFPGGISICAGGGIRFSRNADETYKYLVATNAGRTPDEVLRSFAQNMVGLDAFLMDLGKAVGATVSTQERAGNYAFEGYEHIPTVSIERIENFDPAKEYPHVRGRQGVNLFKMLHEHVKARDIDLRLGHAAKRLLRNAAGEIVGIAVERLDGTSLNVGIRRGVVLAKHVE